jgi:hypothetical protein
MDLLSQDICFLKQSSNAVILSREAKAFSLYKISAAASDYAKSLPQAQKKKGKVETLVFS